MTDDLRYPIGRPELKPELTEAERTDFIARIEACPAELRQALAGLSPEQLETPYRPGGWTLRQVAHHVPDSHMNAYIRFKWTLTEEEPSIKAYHEDRWAQLADSRITPVEVSLGLLESVHRRWIDLLRAMSPADFQRALVHPENGRRTLDQMLALYAWHGAHHTAHVTSLRERMGWS
jgi:uncharacterized damage-inducible protein DinB